MDESDAFEPYGLRVVCEAERAWAPAHCATSTPVGSSPSTRPPASSPPHAGAETAP